jgi:competence protein ComEC
LTIIAAFHRLGADRDTLRQQVARLYHRAGAANEGRLTLWLPVAMAAGIGAYFALPVEPGVLPVGFAIVGMVFWGWSQLAGRRSAAATLAAMALFGMLLAKGHVWAFSGPAIAAVTEEIHVEGFVEQITRGLGRSATVILRIGAATGLPDDQRPKRIRISTAVQKDLRVGDHIEAELRLNPLLTPVAPRAFDFARTQWLQGIGASASTRTPLRINRNISPPNWLAFRRAIDAARFTISGRIRNAMPDELGLLAVALVTGERAGLPPRMKDSLQASGLAHVVSISGLHMSLVAGSLFWIIRGLLALSIHLALRKPIKKWAAAAALIAGAFYLALSGCEVPAQRSYLMLAIMFAAVLVGRPALSLRNVALAAMVAMVLDPAAVLQPGLQMSFLAVTGLLSFFEARRMDRSLPPIMRRGRVVHAAMRLTLAFLTLAATTVIAGICTGPPAAYHFGRVSPYSLVGNLLALPIVSSIIMPMALAGTVMMPVGLEHLPFAIMHMGLRSLMAISDWTASLPGARYFVPGQTAISAVVFSAGILHICLVRGAVRWFGVAIFAVGFFLAMLTPRPDVLIERTGRNVAIRNGADELVIANPRRSRFAVERWLIADGDDASPSESAGRQGWQCAGHLCLAVVKDKRIAFAQAEAEGKLTCPDADILVAGFPLRKACSSIPLRIDRFDVWRMGAHALFIDGGTIRTQTARSVRGARPWVTEPRARRMRPQGRSMAVQ